MTGRERPGQPDCPTRGAPIGSLGYSADDHGILTIARYYFHSFADPAGQGWIGAVSASLQYFGDRQGPAVAVATLGVVQAMRRSRWSMFRFNSADCPRCAAHATAHEQQLMAVIRAIEQGRIAAAEAHVHLLCEGNDIRAVLRAMQTLVADMCGTTSDAPPTGQGRQGCADAPRR